MTPGLAFFYGGMVRAKNVLAMLMQNFFALGHRQRPVGASSATRSRSAAPDDGCIGNFDFVGLEGRGAHRAAGLRR